MEQQVVYDFSEKSRVGLRFNLKNRTGKRPTLLIEPKIGTGQIFGSSRSNRSYKPRPQRNARIGRVLNQDFTNRHVEEGRIPLIYRTREAALDSRSNNHSVRAPKRRW